MEDGIRWIRIKNDTVQENRKLQMECMIFVTDVERTVAQKLLTVPDGNEKYLSNM